MATTSIWSVKGQLGKVVVYVENPEKTSHPQTAPSADGEGKPELSAEADRDKTDTQSLSDVIAYAVDVEKTRLGGNIGKKGGGVADERTEIMEQYVSGIHCTPSTARAEMMAVKKRYGKEDGIMAFHGYQSFAPGECTPAMAHEIGLELAEELWGERFQVLVATHLDKAHHLHNHFVVNSVSFADGRRYHRSNQDYRDMRSVSDRLCREHGLSVIENAGQKRTKHYAEWRAEQEGKPTYHSMVKADVDEAIREARTEKQFFHYLKEKGYSIKSGKDVTVRAEGRDRGIKLARNFGEGYTMEAIRKRILTQTVKQTGRQMRKNPHIVRVHGNTRPAKKIGGLRGLYLHYCFLLGILPANTPVSPKQVHMLFREDLIKLDTISKETTLLCRYRIDTAEQLFSLKEKLQKKMEELTDTRKHLRCRKRSIHDEGRRSEITKEITDLTKQIGKLKKEVTFCDGIAARSGVIKEKIKTVRQEMQKGKEDTAHEHIRRSR